MFSTIHLHRFAIALSALLTALTLSACSQSKFGLALPQLRYDCPTVATGGGLPTANATCELLDFGDVDVGSTATRSVRLGNAGRIALGITDTTLVNDLLHTFSLQGEPAKVGVGASDVLLVRFSPTAPGAASAVLTIHTNDPAHAEVQIPVRGLGVGHPVPAVMPAMVDFGEVLLGDTGTAALSISNEGNVPMVLSAVVQQTGTAFATTPVNGTVVMPGASVELMPTFMPADVGTVTATLTLTTDAFADHPTETDVMTTTVMLTGTGIAPGPRIRVTPASVDFTTVGTPGNRTATITVANAGTGILTVAQVRLAQGTPADFTLGTELAANTPIGAGASTTFTVTYHGHPAATETLVAGTIEVLSDDAATPTATVALSGSCLAAFTGGPDGDGDGIPDACDLCLYDGPTPPALVNSVSGAGLAVSNGIIDGAGNVHTNVAPGSTINVEYDWSVTSGPNCGYCPTCITQFYVSVDGSATGTDCFYNSSGACSYPSSGHQHDVLTVPTAPGTYYVGFTWSWEYYCHEANYGGHVGLGSAFGVVCVR